MLRIVPMLGLSLVFVVLVASVAAYNPDCLIKVYSAQRVVYDLNPIAALGEFHFDLTPNAPRHHFQYNLAVCTNFTCNTDFGVPQASGACTELPLSFPPMIHTLGANPTVPIASVIEDSFFNPIGVSLALNPSPPGSVATIFNIYCNRTATKPVPVSLYNPGPLNNVFVFSFQHTTGCPISK